MKKLSTDINEVIGYLALADPIALETLRAKFPQYSSILKLGITLGDSKNLYLDLDEAFVRSMTCKTGLESVLKKCDELLPILKRKLKILGNIQLGSQVTIGIAGSSLLIKSYDNIPAITTVTGLLTLFGSILNLIVQLKSGTILNDSQSIFSYYDKLIDNKFEAEQQLLEIELALQAFKDDNPNRLVTVINKSNQLCLELRKIIEKV